MSAPSDWSSFFTRSELPDFIQQPLVRREPVSRLKLFARTALILASEFCERMAFYSIAANLFFFMTNQMDLGADVSNILLLAFVGTCYVSPLFGGYLADAFLGRFQTIVLFDVAYVVGMALLAGGTFLGPKEVHWLIYVSLFTIAIGTGGIKANVIPFGAFISISAPSNVQAPISSLMSRSLTPIILNRPSLTGPTS